MVAFISLSKAFEQNKKLLKVFGLWTSNNKWYNFYKTIIYGIMVLTPFSSFIQIILNNGNYVETNFVVPSQLEGLLKLIFFRKHYSKILIMCDILESKCLQPKNIRQEKILQDMVHLSRLLHDQYFRLILALCLMAFGPYYFSRDYNLLIPIWVPFNYKKSIYFYLLYSYMFVYAHIITLISFSTDAFLYLSIMQIGAQFDCISDSLEYSNEIKNLTKREILVVCIKHYNLLLQYGKTLQKAFKENITAQVAISVGSICFTLYYMSKVRKLLFL